MNMKWIGMVAAAALVVASLSTDANCSTWC
jgi:hypothetical protein